MSTLNSDPGFINDTSKALNIQIQEYLQKIAVDDMHELTRNEVAALASDISEKYINSAVVNEYGRDQGLTYVFSRICISRAKITLALWDRNT